MTQVRKPGGYGEVVIFFPTKKLGTVSHQCFTYFLAIFFVWACSKHSGSYKKNLKPRG